MHLREGNVMQNPLRADDHIAIVGAIPRIDARAVALRLIDTGLETEKRAAGVPRIDIGGAIEVRPTDDVHAVICRRDVRLVEDGVERRGPELDRLLPEVVRRALIDDYL